MKRAPKRIATVNELVQFARPDHSSKCALSRDEVARASAEAVQRVLEHSKIARLPKRRSRQRLSQWTIKVAAACVGNQNICMHAGESPGYFSIPERRIVIGRKYIENGGDVAFTIGHELGHWAWHVLFAGKRGQTTAQYIAEERFANAFARALIERDALDEEMQDKEVAW